MLSLSKTDSYLLLSTIALFLVVFLAIDGAYADTIHQAYIGYFFDKITFLVGCL